MGYIIVGEHEKFGTCLISVINGDMELANKTLDRLVNNPTNDDLFLISGISNLRIKEDEGWWNE